MLEGKVSRGGWGNRSRGVKRLRKGKYPTPVISSLTHPWTDQLSPSLLHLVYLCISPASFLKDTREYAPSLLLLTVLSNTFGSHICVQRPQKRSIGPLSSQVLFYWEMPLAAGTSEAQAKVFVLWEVRKWINSSSNVKIEKKGYNKL